ncbi:Phox-like protein [Conidiobolus coronatus NRRL 28638]|uniref:Phox-like protein n=1 Tax=Conidiobolus coronatus (strain ATCC 28846 / CBS 209.66 / NRRL 28638) TaxID=796925 RepID=A0A137PGP6_CONC2|nr:Phox-like protein [Conidiobolus coronatus NRRL 28638]|eukprot:KXN74158.1 Phox-like protein [Conidiobolus coronatus NRRL 28638]
MVLEKVESILIERSELRTIPSSHISYRLTVRAAVRSWTVWHRYSEFVQLSNDLKRAVPSKTFPCQLPPKTSFTCISYDDEALIHQRRVGLQAFLREILLNKDESWRSTKEWAQFLQIPSNRTNNQNEEYSSKGWLSQHSVLQELVRDIRSTLIKREAAFSKGDQSLAHHLAAQARRQLVGLNTQLTQLDISLAALAKGPNPSLSEGELLRRRNLLSHLENEKHALMQLAQKNVSDHSSSRAVGAATESDRSELFRVTSPIHSNRVFGRKPDPKETAETRQLDNADLLQLQKDKMVEQDDYVGQFISILQKQRNMGDQIGEELDYHNQLLNEFSMDVDNTEANISKVNEMTKKIR